MKLISITKLILQNIFLLIFLNGCVANDIVVFDETKRHSKSNNEVKVLLNKPERPYKVIARIQIGPDAFISDYQNQTEELVKKAAKLGADAVIISYGSSAYPGASKFTVGMAIIYITKDKK